VCLSDIELGIHTMGLSILGALLVEIAQAGVDLGDLRGAIARKMKEAGLDSVQEA